MSDWKAADIVTLTQDRNFIVVGEAINETTKEPCVVFRDLNGTAPLKVLDKEMFEKVFTLVERV